MNPHALVSAVALLLICGCQTANEHGPSLAIQHLSLSDPETGATTWQPVASTSVRSSVPVEQDDDGWRFVIAPYAWLLSADGTAEVGGTTTVVDEDFSDIFDMLSFVIEGRFEAWKGRWGILADITYARLENDAQVGAVELDTTTDLTLGVFGGMYRFVDQEPAAENGAGGAKVDGIFGVSYISIEAEIDSPGPDPDGDEDWFDPILGLRSRWSFSEKWSGHLEAVIGGFELFDGSELFTMFTVLAGRKVGKSSHFYFGWRSLDFEYDDGSSFEADIRLSGPIIGFEWSF